MKYFINGTEVSREEVQERLTKEMHEAENSPNFMGRIHYNLNYIDHVAQRFMKENGRGEFLFDEYAIVMD